MYRSHFNVELLTLSDNSDVTISGWVHQHRDFGGMIFVQLRDKTGLIQVVCDPQLPQVFDVANQLRREYVVSISGVLKLRPQENIKGDKLDGRIEVFAKAINLLNKAIPLPFYPDDKQTPQEEIRLRYRYLDLRRIGMTNNLALRAKLIHTMRNFLHAKNFIEIETPMLTKATPEGARDYLVPSRVHNNKFYALPQSPQLFKQLLMMAGQERYYQVVKCFRDEDLRSDRQPEFTQLDIELSFVTQADIMRLIEQMLSVVFSECLGIILPQIPRITYQQAICKYASDKPDLRNPLYFVDVADIFLTSNFTVFANIAAEKNTRIVALKLIGQANKISRKKQDEYQELAKKYGIAGLSFLKVDNHDLGLAGIKSPLQKFLTQQDYDELHKRLSLAQDDMVIFAAGYIDSLHPALAVLRDNLADDLDLRTAAWSILWVTDFPLLEWDCQQNRWVAMHHPFTAPQRRDDLQYNLENALAQAYDLVINGSEVGGGSMRIHDHAMQQQMLNCLGLTPEQSQDKFGFLLEALQYGCPPHGGIAIGVDRLTAIICGESSIRECIAFPKTLKAQCLLTSAPDQVTTEQLSELGIQLKQNLFN